MGVYKMLEKIATILRDYTGDKNLVVTNETILIADLGFHSLDLANLACAVEDEFDIEIPDRAIKDFKTIGDVISFIEQQ